MINGCTKDSVDSAIAQLRTKFDCSLYGFNGDLSTAASAGDVAYQEIRSD